MQDIIIIGAGPAGMTAAVYGARAGLDVLVLEGAMAGGQALNAHNIENYPGFENGVSGYELAYAMQNQLKRLGAKLVSAAVTDVRLNGAVKEIITAKETYTSKTVIIATGAKPKKLGVEREDEFTGAGVSYCATCDGGFFKNKTVAVVGGGDTALSDAIYLARIAKKVYIIHRRDEFRAAKSLVNAALALENVEPLYDTVVSSLEGSVSLEALLVKNVKSSAVTRLEVDGVFAAVGSVPQTEIFTGQLELKDGCVEADDTVTGAAGVFAAGDVVRGVYRQVVTACAAGAVAAMKAAEYINEVENG